MTTLYTKLLFVHSKDKTSQMVIDHIKKIKLKATITVRTLLSDIGIHFKKQFWIISAPIRNLCSLLQVRSGLDQDEDMKTTNELIANRSKH